MLDIPGIESVDLVAAKAFLERFSAISHDAMHVIAGVLIQLLLAALLRTSVARFLPWGILLLLELANEWNDLSTERWNDAALQWGEVAKDVALTMALPTLLLLLARFSPGLFARRS